MLAALLGLSLAGCVAWRWTRAAVPVRWQWLGADDAGRAGPAMTAAALELYVRDGCHLCDEFLLDLSLDHPGLLARPRDRATSMPDAALAAEFGLRVPVLEVGGQVACEGRYDRDEVARPCGL